MGWERHRIITPVAPEPLSLWRWILVGILSVIVSILLFVLHATEHLFFINNVNIWLVSLFPVFLWLIIASIRGYLYGRALEYYEFLQKEILISQREWQSWGQRSIVVMNSCVLLPEKITVAIIAGNSKNIANQYDLVNRINYLPQVKNQCHAAAVLLNSIAESLSILPTGIPLHVTLVTDGSTEEICLLQSNFHRIWQTSLPAKPQPSSVRIVTEFPCHQLDTNLKDAEVRSDLFLILQFNGHDKYSDGMAVFLLASDDVARNYGLEGKCRLLRPMPLDKSCLSQDLTSFFTTQVSAKKTRAIVSDYQSIASLSTQLYPIAHENGVHWQVENTIVLERFMGIPGPFSGWLCAGVTADMSKHHSAPYLIVSVQEQQPYICTVLPWSDNEYDKPSME
ncbi:MULTISPECIES: hypothetical protein [unclassified Citrobacter]|nr:MULTISPECIES: hypothetical protein [unclassified Citrobacter]TKU29677.1 hypothetical protein FDX09_14895 [Citrobacter sp. wls717]TKU84521.1 hypothetical protein FDX13_10760 [Citrobacter sp. wls707]